jgi:hypothetical protein
MVKNSKFDLDLQYGQLREQQVHDMFHNKKIEIKTERDWWKKTGNIAIEYECNGKPSGIDKTESDFWIQILSLGVDNYCKLIFEVPRLKRIVEKYKSTHSRMVGDRNASKCVLIPLNELFEKDNVAV